MPRTVSATLLLVVAAFTLVASSARCQEKNAAAKDAPPLNAAEKKFAELLTDAQLLGHYTLWGHEDKPKRDTYTIERVAKQDDEHWLFVARIQYGKRDVKLPLQLKVLWAGDTPVITLDKILVPGIGTFSARVVFHDEQYAGTWDGGDHGGHMYGVVTQAPADDAKPGE